MLFFREINKGKRILLKNTIFFKKKVAQKKKYKMKGKKNDFSMTFYLENERVMFMEYVHNTEKAIKWMEEKNKSWSHAMIYDRRTREKIERIKNENY